MLHFDWPALFRGKNKQKSSCSCVDQSSLHLCSFFRPPSSFVDFFALSSVCGGWSIGMLCPNFDLINSTWSWDGKCWMVQLHMWSVTLSGLTSYSISLHTSSKSFRSMHLCGVGKDSGCVVPTSDGLWKFGVMDRCESSPELC